MLHRPSQMILRSNRQLDEVAWLFWLGKRYPRLKEGMSRLHQLLGGMVLRPHRPPNVSGSVFFTLEGETALAQATLLPEVYQRLGVAMYGLGMLVVSGRGAATADGRRSRGGRTGTRPPQPARRYRRELADGEELGHPLTPPYGPGDKSLAPVAPLTTAAEPR